VKEKYARLGTIEGIVTRKAGSPKLISKRKDITLSDEPVPEKALKGNAIDSATG